MSNPDNEARDPNDVWSDVNNPNNESDMDTWSDSNNPNNPSYFGDND